MSRIALALLIGLTVFAPACGRRNRAPEAPNLTQRRYDKLLSDARGDLVCKDIQYQYLGEDIHNVQGCGKQKSYLLYCSGPVCRWVIAPAELAAVEMSCPAASLTATKITPSVYVIEGCNQKRSYTLQGSNWTGETMAPAPAAVAEAPEAQAPEAQDPAAAPTTAPAK